MLISQVTTPPAPTLTLDDELRALATFASIALALLTLFTNRRMDRLAKQGENGLAKFKKAWKSAIPDILLALGTLLALATMFPAFHDSIDLDDWFASDHTLESMFSLVYVGFACVFIWQAWIVSKRIRA